MYSFLRKVFSLSISIVVTTSVFSQNVAVSFTADKTKGCIPVVVKYTNTTPNASSYTFKWEMSDGQTSEMVTGPSATYISAGKKNITLVAYDGKGTEVGRKEEKNMITVFEKPVVKITAPSFKTCKNSSLTFSSEVVSSDAPIKSYVWEFGSGVFDTSRTPTHTFKDVRDSAVQLLVYDTNGCENGAKRARAGITISGVGPSASFTFPDNKSSTCEGSATINLTNTSTVTEGTITGYTWTFPDGTESNEKNPIKSFTRNGTMDAKLITLKVMGSNECYGIVQKYFTLYDLQPSIRIYDTKNPTVYIEDDVDSMVCPGNTVTLEAMGGGIQQCKWDLDGDGTIDTSVYTKKITITPPSTGNIFTVGLTAVNPACSVSAPMARYRVEPKIDFDITPKDVLECKSPYATSFSVPSSNVTASFIEWSINKEIFDTTYTASSLTQKEWFEANNEFDISVRMMSINKCWGEKAFEKTVKVYKPMIDYSITVLDQPNAPAQQGCVPLKTRFEDLSTYKTPHNDDSIKSISWNFGDNSAEYAGKQGDKVVHTYGTVGIYKPVMTLETYNGCKYTMTKKVEVGDSLLNVTFKINDSIVCQGTGIKIDEFNRNNQGTKQIDSVYVEFKQHYGTLKYTTNSDKESVDPELNIIFKHPKIKGYSSKNDTGIYDLHIDAFFNGCPAGKLDSTKRLYIKGPWAYIDPAAVSCDKPMQAGLHIDTVHNHDSCEWRIYKSDENNRYRENMVIKDPQYDTVLTFDSTGSYLAMMYAYFTDSADRCIDTVKTLFNITNTKTRINYVTDTTPCFYSNIQFRLDSLRDRRFITCVDWYLTQPDLSVDKQDSHMVRQNEYKVHKHKLITRELGYTTTVFFENRGVHLLTVSASDVNNCVHTITDTIRAYGPNVNFRMDPVTTCLPITLGFYDKSTSFGPIVQRRWYTNGQTGSYLTGNSIEVKDVYKEPHTYTVKLEVEDSKGCIDALTKKDSVIPFVPTAKITLDNQKVCVGSEAVLRSSRDLPVPFKNKVDSMVWTFGSYKTVRTKNTDSVKIIFDREFDKETVLLTTYANAPNGDVCAGKDSTKLLDIKNASAANTQLIKDEITCYTGQLTVDATSSKNYDDIEWFEYYKSVSGRDSIVYKGNKALSQFMFSGAGSHVYKMKTSSSYKGCKSDTIMREYIIPKSEATIVYDKQTVCVNEAIKFSLRDTVNLSRYKHKWTFGDGFIDSTSYEISHDYRRVFDNGEVSVSFIIENECKDFDTTIIKVHTLLSDFSRGGSDNDSAGCVPFEPSFINTSRVENNRTITYTWDFGDGVVENGQNAAHKYEVPNQKYTVKLTVDDQICKDEQEKNIMTLQKPGISYQEIGTICADSVLQIVLTPDAGTTITSWNDVNGLVLNTDKTIGTIKPLTNTTFIVDYAYVGVGGIACEDKDTMTVKVQHRPEYFGIPKNYLVLVPRGKPHQRDTLKEKQKDLLYTFERYSVNNDSLPGITYKWETSEGLSCDNCYNPNVMITRDMTYKVTMTDSMGCFTVVEEVPLKAIFSALLGMPEAFTPNGDGNNDIAIPRGWAVKEFIELRIYNRWGQLVYVSNELDKGWDGTFNGKPQDPDTFAWTIKYKDIEDKEFLKKGYITLLR